METMVAGDNGGNGIMTCLTSIRFQPEVYLYSLGTWVPIVIEEVLKPNRYI